MWLVVICCQVYRNAVGMHRKPAPIRVASDGWDLTLMLIQDTCDDKKELFMRRSVTWMEEESQSAVLAGAHYWHALKQSKNARTNMIIVFSVERCPEHLLAWCLAMRVKNPMGKVGFP